ncbi:hypothetical protein [Piscinibacter terrae]|uniref:hypothetical protein n=1 Tax=Piscinibacter terrae TaxID=2496871 RepID=UPI001387107B|nr:hypothetical protein [Albitalea terrae]
MLQSILEFIGNCSNVFGMAAGVFAILTWMQVKIGQKRELAEINRLDQKIKVF